MIPAKSLMMTLCRVHYYRGAMKQILMLVLILLVSTGCKKKDGVVFCEGTDKSGSGVKCGSVFTTGDITVVASTDKPFNTDTVYVKLYDTKDGDALPESIIDVKVDPASMQLRADLSIYDESDYKVVIENKDRKPLAEGTVKIIENY
jgi:hypothetical protein